MPKQMPAFDQRLGGLESPANELEGILNQIRLTSDRIAGESWDQFYDRTLHLAYAELARRQRLRRQTSPTPPNG